MRLAMTASTCQKFGPWSELRSRLPIGARLRRRERRRIQEEQTAVLDERIDAGHEVRTAHVAAGAAAGRVDDRRATRRGVVEHVARRIDVDDVVAGDLHFHRQAAARVEDAAERPSALQRAGARRVVERAEVERVAHVEEVVAVLVGVPVGVIGPVGRPLGREARRIARRPRLVRPARRALAVRQRVLPVQREAVAATGGSAPAAARCSCRCRRSSCSRLRRRGSARWKCVEPGQRIPVPVVPLAQVTMANSRTTVAADRAVRLHADDLVRDAAQEQIASLAADVGRGRRHPAAEILLHRRRVLVHLLRQRVVVGVGARLVGAVVRVVDEVGANHGRRRPDTRAAARTSASC